jgi:hypothetical protein
MRRTLVFINVPIGWLISVRKQRERQKNREEKKKRRTQVNSRTTSLLILSTIFSYKRNNI